ncbi:hypothetical protein AB5N19_05464 [Seiridium cardinale]|uniref:Uncharacterized protein n=1 Tax=Seiridium cardinale TaxID=138064 RepID=A0ABR2XIN1_9PEZI
MLPSLLGAALHVGNQQLQKRAVHQVPACLKATLEGAAKSAGRLDLKKCPLRNIFPPVLLILVSQSRAAVDGTIPRCGAAIGIVVQSAKIPYAGVYCLRGVIAFGILAGRRSGIPTARMVCEQRLICLLRLKTRMRESCLLVFINPSRLGWPLLGPPSVTASWYAKEASIAAGFEDE